MMDDARAEAKGQLALIIQRVVAEGRLGDEERQTLQALYRQALLTVSDVREVLTQHLRALQAEVLADGRVTEEDRQRCRAVVSQLKIPPALLSAQIKAIIGFPS
jgi:uncharacterized tellurite resistance protein B-like protein